MLGCRMENRRLSAPQVKGYDQAYELSYQLACETLAATADIGAQCLKAGAEYYLTGPRPEIALQFLGRRHVIKLPGIDIIVPGSTETVTLRDKLLILHYLNTARGTPPNGIKVTFRDLPAGPVYFRQARSQANRRCVRCRSPPSGDGCHEDWRTSSRYRRRLGHHRCVPPRPHNVRPLDWRR
jgi:hypothetical protein